MHLIERHQILAAVRNRVSQYEGAHDAWLRNHFEPLFERLTIRSIAWETIVSDIAAIDRPYGAQVARFYEDCKRFNAPTDH